MKAVLVIDVPNELEGCTVIADCKLHRVYDKEGNYYLEKKDSLIGNRNGIYLKPLPQELDNISALPEDPNSWSFVHYESLGYEEGWNACLVEIMGETE